ncbi:hypothetical protein SUGI_0689760 [Cryptomeria japonica]|nr:hypothetical protein SUGI_0689760 [Cryptomeria japonica]
MAYAMALPASPPPHYMLSALPSDKASLQLSPSYVESAPSPADHMTVHMVTCSANTSTNVSVKSFRIAVNKATCSAKSSASNSANISVDYMATCSANCSASCAGNHSVSCSANCSAPNFGDCLLPTRYALSPVDHLVPPDWVRFSFFTTFADLFTLVCYGVFSFLIVLDVLGAIEKRATWLPAKAFSLTGVIVQIIVWWTSVSSINNKCKKDVGMNESVVHHQLVLSGKVAVCVFIGYLLPGMAASSVTTFLALGLTICVQITSELLIFQKPHDVNHYVNPGKSVFHPQNHDAILEEPNDWTTWANIANSTLLLCIIVLGLILVCTILASQTIHDLLKQRTSTIFSINKEDERIMSSSWDDFDDEVLSSWLVARVCQADYVISRSIFSSAVGVVITLCVIISLLSNTFHNIYFSHRHLAPIDYAIFSLLFSFIIIGWIVICSRWFSAQLYFRSHRQSWRRCLSMEDFWTRNTVELIRMYDLKRDRQQFFKMQKSTSTMLSKLQRLPTHIFTKAKLHKFVYLGLMLQLSVVLFSKLCGLLSEVIIGNFLYCFRKHVRCGHQVKLHEESHVRILGLICMPGEDPIDLWEANEMAFNQAKALLQKGCEKGEALMQKSCEKGESSEEIDSNFRPYSVQWADDGKQLLKELQKSALPLVLKHFPSIEKQSVRITAVSLIKIFIILHKPKSHPLKKDMKSDPVKKVMKACDDVWDLLRFADECDIDLQANEISLLDDLRKEKDQIGMAAETEFYKLQMEYENPPSCEDCATDAEGARRILKDLSGECEELLRNENLLEGTKNKNAANLSDSKDWMEIAPKYNLYKLCKLMLANEEEDFVAWTKNALQNVLAFSLTRLPDMLVKQCWKWAQEFEEDKLWEAIDLAGKCKGIMKAWERNPKLTRNATFRRNTIQEKQSI